MGKETILNGSERFSETLVSMLVGNAHALKTMFMSFRDVKLLTAALFITIVEFMGYVHFNELLWLAVLIGLDFMTGIIKASVKDGVHSITSKRMRDTVFKVTQYGAFLIAMHVVVNRFGHFQESETLPNLVLYYSHVFLLVIEVKSIFENIATVNENFLFLRQLNKLMESPLQRIKRVIVVESVKLNVEKKPEKGDDPYSKEYIQRILSEKRRIEEHLAAYEERLSQDNILISSSKDGTLDIKNINESEDSNDSPKNTTL